MKDSELEAWLTSIEVPEYSEDLPNRIIRQSCNTNQEKTFKIRIFDLLFSKLTAYAAVPAAACLLIGIFVYMPDEEPKEIDMVEYAEVFLLEEVE